MRGTLDLDQGIELVTLRARLLLCAVAKQVWKNCLVVRNVSAQRDGERLAFSMPAEENIKMIVKNIDRQKCSIVIQTGKK